MNIKIARLIRRAFASVVLAFFSLGPATAREVTIEFSGVADRTVPPELTGLRADDPVTGTITFDDEAAPTSRGQYPIIGATLTLRMHTASGFTDQTFESDPAGSNYVRISNSGYPRFDLFADIPGIGGKLWLYVNDAGAGVGLTFATDSIAELAGLARSGRISDFTDRSIYINISGAGPWGDCSASKEMECPEFSAQLREFRIAAGSESSADRCSADFGNAPICLCAQDDLHGVFRCAMLDPAYFAIVRWPWPITPGESYAATFDVLPLTQWQQPVTVSLSGANIPKSYSKLQFDGKSLKTLESRKLVLKAPEKPTTVPGEAVFTYGDRTIKLDMSVLPEQFGEQKKLDPKKLNLKKGLDLDRRNYEPKKQ